MCPRYQLIDGAERNEQYPEQFWFPGFEAISSLKVGDVVKIGVEFSPDPETGQNGERFWVKIASAFESGPDTCFTGIIDNNLYYTANHGLQLNNEISFEPKNVLAIWRG